MQIKDVLRLVRTEKEIPQEELCRGLCPRSTYARYESGKQQPNRLLLNSLLQRLGKSPDKFASVLSDEEYQYFYWKKNTLIAAERKDLTKLELLIKESADLKDVLDENLHKQFMLQMQAMLMEAVYHDMNKSIDCLWQAVRLTVPDIQANNINSCLLSVEEITIMIHLAEALKKGNRDKEAAHMLMLVTEYAEKRYDDYEVKVRVIPKAVKDLMPLLIKREEYEKGRVLAKKAIDLLCWNGVLYDLLDLMEYYLVCSKHNPDEVYAKYYTKQAQALRDIYREYDSENRMQGKTSLEYYNHELYLTEEIMKRCRSFSNMSQEALSEGICTAENLSRIETGKHKPNIGTFQTIMDKLESGLDYYNPELDTDNFLLLEKKLELTRYMSLFQWKEAREVLEVLKKELDMSREMNWKNILMKEKAIQFHNDEITAKEFRSYCEAYMGCKEETWKNEDFWKQFFAYDKANAMNYLSLTYSKEGRKENSIFILEHLLRELGKSKISMSDRYRTCITLIGNLTALYGEMGNLGKCLEMCETGINLCMVCGKGIRLSELLSNKAEAMNELENRPTEASERIFENAYHMSRLFSVPIDSAYINSYYQEHYDKNVRWY